MNYNILVTGATGKIGMFLLEDLKEAGADFTAMVRNEERASNLIDKGFKTVIADFDDPGSLEKAMQGFKKVVLITPPHPEQDRQQMNVVEAAGNAGVLHLIKVSALGISEDSSVSLSRMHAMVEAKIRKTEMSYTFLHPHSFMQNLLSNARTIKEMNTVFSPLGDARIPMVDARDVASVAARVCVGEGHEGKTYIITGPQAVSYDDIAQVLSEKLGKEISHSRISLEDSREAMIEAGLPTWLAEDLTELNKIFSSGVAEDVSPDVKNVTGKDPISVAQFASDFSHMFQEES